MKHHNSYGFTIIELLIAVFISSIVLAGAFGIQAVFNQTATNEEGVSDLQNSLNSVKMYFRKTVKRSGAGLGSTVVLNNCSGGYEYLPTIMIHNRNDYPAQADNTLGGTDNDPDWIEFIAPSSVAVTSVASWLRITDWATVNSTIGFKANDVVAITVNGVSCLMRINYVYNTTTTKYLGWYYRGGQYCMNPSTNTHIACGFLTNNSYTPKTTVPLTTLGEFPFVAFRVDLSNPKNPLLMYGQRNLEYGGTNYTWSVMAEGIEDLQIAFHVDTSNPMDGRGEMWINSRDILATEYGRVRSVRFSIVARSTHAMSSIRTRRPAYEDRTMGTLDNYSRRKVTFVVQLPNRPITGGTLP
ncbi:PilW family protein [Myxococcota bacterium]|nr:PilW family protein [Myxococcota bacterium]